MFQPSSYPQSLPKPHKLRVFEHQAKSLGLDHRLYRPPLTISFDDCTNSAGVTMRPSAGSGSECTGLNDGSKNSVLTTYLADAWTWGAEIFCGVDVSHVQRHEREEGYTVHFSLTNSRHTNQTMWIHAVRKISRIGQHHVRTDRVVEGACGTWSWRGWHDRASAAFSLSGSSLITPCRSEAFWQRRSSCVRI